MTMWCGRAKLPDIRAPSGTFFVTTDPTSEDVALVWIVDFHIFAKNYIWIDHGLSQVV